MSDNLLTSKIELLEEQIENIERSGFFTEAEIDRASKSLRAEKSALQLALSHTELTTTVDIASSSFQPLGKSLYGMTPEDYAEAVIYHNKCFDQLKMMNPAFLNSTNSSNNGSR